MRPSSAHPAHPASPAGPESRGGRAPANRTASTPGTRPEVPAAERGLRKAVLIDGVVALVFAPLLVAAAVPLADPLGLSVPLLVGAGIVLLVLGSFLWVTARRVPLQRGAVYAVLALNSAWMLASVVVLLVSSPTTGGVVLVVGQGLAALGFSVAEAVGLRRVSGAR